MYKDVRVPSNILYIPLPVQMHKLNVPDSYHNNIHFHINLKVRINIIHVNRAIKLFLFHKN